MSVVGIDLGNMNTVIAVARNRGVDIICNEVSNRTTPTMVAFTPKNRNLGESAKTNEISNFRSTVSNIKRILGRSLEEVQATEGKYINAQLTEKDGEAAAAVQYCGEEASFTGTEMMAMFLGKLKDITQAEVKNSAMDVVLAVPPYFNDRQRRALLDAAEIAGVRCLRLINENTAAALAYGMPKNDLPEDGSARNVVFVDVGQSAYSVTVAAFKKGQLEVKGVGFDAHFGGRDFDEALVEHFCAEFTSTRKLDIKSNRKATHRLRMAAERAKKVLSANAKTQLQVENIMDEVDVSAEITRQAFEELIAPLMARFPGPIKQALEMAGLEAHQIDSVELVGGTTRIPAIKNCLMTIFGKELSTTLNQDEAVARGCALQCALQSPVFKVREFAVQDCTAVGVKFCWEAIPEQPEDTEYLVFPPRQTIPSTKLLSFCNRPLPLHLSAVYAQESQQKVIGQYSIGSEAEFNSALMLKVKVRVSPSGLYSVEGAHYIADKDDGSGSVEIGVQFQAKTASLDKKSLQEKAEAEASMAASDKLVADTSDARNALEEYIYEMRGKLEEGGKLAPYGSDDEKQKLASLMSAAEEWLYTEEGEEATKSVYAQKLQSLKAIGGPISERFREHDAVPQAAELLRSCVAEYRALGASIAHLDDNDRAKINGECDKKLKWLEDVLAKQASKPLYQSLVVTSAQIVEEKNRLISACFPIVNKPKPKPATVDATGQEAPKSPASSAEKKPEEELLLTDEEDGQEFEMEQN